ncbi:MAG: alpha/beta hydrolase [Crocinitomicaceae bacterium]|nr:alpha/beta hydrolase [Crocinitomicaceae bacterium]
MIRIKNEIFVGSDGRKSLVDITIPENFNHKIIFFVHGYKGYKDWGPWNEIEKRFVLNGFAFVKFNLTHNGGTIENPIDFPDLEAFSENTYSKEIHDIETVLRDFRLNFQETWNDSKKILIGHSRGGGDVVLTAAKNQDIVDSIVTWAAISDIEERFPSGEELQKWEKEGVMYVENARTHQQMPHKFSFYTDFQENMDQLNIQSAARKIHIPWLIVHGDQDLAVTLDNAERLKDWSNADLQIIKGANHTFNTAHPFEAKVFEKQTQELIDVTLSFLNSL